jgi:hypothetical protein
MLTYMHKQMINDISNEQIINQFANSSLCTETAPNAMKTLKSIDNNFLSLF